MKCPLNRKRRMISSLASVCILWSACFLWAHKGPKIVFREDSWNFGKVEQGNILTHVFVFKNDGNQALRIKRVRTTCGCTAALVSEREIAPGKEGEIKVTFNTRGYGGKVSKHIFIESNDDSHSNKRLTVSANIEVPPRPKIDLDHYSHDLGLCLDTERIKARTKIKNRGELELKIKCSHRDASFFTKSREISFPLSIPSGEEVEVEVIIPPRKRPGVLREYIIIESNDPMRHKLSLYLSGYVISKKQLREIFTKYREILEK